MQAILPFASVTAMTELRGKLQKACVSDQSCSDQMVNTAKCLAVHYESFSLADFNQWLGESKPNRILLLVSLYIYMFN